MTLFEHADYKVFIKNWLKSQPKAGRGLLKQWSEKLGVSTTLMSQIFNADKELSLELASEFCDLMNFSDGEADYFLMLVEYSRAGSVSLRKRLKRKIESEQKKAQNIGQRLKVEELPDFTKAIFYSNWMYTGIRNLTAIPGLQTVDSLAEHLKMPRVQIQKVIEFLLENGLCVMEKGKLHVGPKRTHIGANSPLVAKHHQNWRLQSFQKMPLQKEEDLFFTFPMSLSKADAKKIRQYLPSVIEEIHKIVGPSDSEEVRCLNIDFFEY
jgi:uncharacterized protein (TIGR02147 family)